MAGVWLLLRTFCIKTHGFINPPSAWIQHIFARKTRRGWENVAMNAAAQGEGDLADNEKDAMLRELLDLDHNAGDDDVRERFAEYGTDEDKAENAKRAERRKDACKALGLEADADADTFHNAVLSVPKWLDDLRKEAANARKDAVKALLDLAVNDGRITTAQRPVYETAFNSDFAGTRTKLAGEEKKLNTERLNMQGRKQETATNSELGVQVKEAAVAYQEKHGGAAKCPWHVAWNAQKKDPKFEAYFRKADQEVATS
jgi:hypothetical protein